MTVDKIKKIINEEKGYQENMSVHEGDSHAFAASRMQHVLQRIENEVEECDCQ